MTREQAIRKARALEVLAKDPGASLGEAANAMELFRKLYVEYKISEADLQNSEESVIMVQSLTAPVGMWGGNWVVMLAEAVRSLVVVAARVCGEAGDTSWSIAWSGKSTDVEMAAELMHFFMSCANRAALRFIFVRRQGFLESFANVIRVRATIAATQSAQDPPVGAQVPENAPQRHALARIEDTDYLRAEQLINERMGKSSGKADSSTSDTDIFSAIMGAVEAQKIPLAVNRVLENR